MAAGTVKWFNSNKGYSSIKLQDGSSDVFVHISTVKLAGLSSFKLRVGGLF
jgi:CspA family cold shock protein